MIGKRSILEKFQQLVSSIHPCFLVLFGIQVAQICSLTSRYNSIIAVRHPVESERVTLVYTV